MFCELTALGMSLILTVKQKLLLAIDLLNLKRLVNIYKIARGLSLCRNLASIHNTYDQENIVPHHAVHKFYE